MDLQLVNLDLVKFNNLDCVKIARSSLKIHNNKEEEEHQGESAHPYPDYPAPKTAPEDHQEIL